LVSVSAQGSYFIAEIKPLDRGPGLAPVNAMIYAQHFSQEEFRDWAEDMSHTLIS